MVSSASVGTDILQNETFQRQESIVFCLEYKQMINAHKEKLQALNIENDLK